MSLAIEAIALDKDGVIFDSEMIYHQTLLQSFEQYGLSFDEAFTAQFQGLSAPNTYEILRQNIQQQVDIDEFVGRWMANKDDFYKKNGLDFINGIGSVIKALYDQGYPLALVTSDTQENMLEDFSLTQPDLLTCFSVVVTLDDVNEAKPNPEPYNRAAALLGIESKHMLVLEDSDVGVTAANGAGANVLLYRPHGKTDNNIKQKVLKVIEQPRQLLDFLS